MQNIKSVLQECYGNKAAVTSELVDYILKPGLEVRPPPLLHFPQGLLHFFSESPPAHVSVLTCLVLSSLGQWRCSWISSPTPAALCQRSCCRRCPAQSAFCGARQILGSRSSWGAPTQTMTAWRSSLHSQVLYFCSADSPLISGMSLAMLS